jgi:hypothetical protein
MDVRVENLESRLESRSNAYRSSGRVTAARVYLLYFDIWRVVLQDRSLTPRRVAAMAGLSSDWIVRDIRKKDWFVKNVAHLFDIEKVLCNHPLWQPKTVYGEMSRGTQASFVHRRWVDPFESLEFKAEVERWEKRGSDAAYINEKIDDPWVTILDVTADDPRDYVAISYAGAMTHQFGFSKAGRRLGDHPSPAYVEIATHDFHEVVQTGEARCKDVVRLYDSREDRVIFRTIALPCLSEGKVVSKMKMEHWHPGRLSR